ncbi:hypothetical protein [Mucilaginibacter dorajii]|uniref:Uncharacterized protein n=1 Tax=Mucilaginibacter dorajii TaxID=692994 RepID=A0ABP7R5T8_9SPHI|nr:hypothetical protein [Mucilaginibacter dorajii]MCS3737683.1 hypothetical protein [Mucilaginibacter dorajii]
MIRFTRKEIYQMVWELPMTEIAKKYKISDVGFRKICLRMNIPVPKIGSWAKVKAGHHRRQPKLPAKWDGQDFIELKERPQEQPVKKASERVQLVNEITQKKLPFKVPERLIKPDSLIIAAKESLEKLTDINYPGMAVTTKGQLDIRVAPSNIGRALRFMDTLIKCIRARGYIYEITIDGNYIVVGEVKLKVNFRERTTKFKADKPYQEFEWRPNGKIVFRLDDRLKSEWGDSKTKLLEDQLPKIMAKLDISAKQEEEYLKNARIWQENWEKQRKLQAKRDAHQHEERESFKELLTQAKRWKQAQLIREYLAAIPSPNNDWRAWARHKADWLDPVTMAEDEWMTEGDKDIF